MAVEDAPSSASLRRENARLRRELAALRDELSGARARETEALDQQAAAGRVLQVLGGSRADPQPVFDAILASAVQLCHGVIGSLFRFDGQLITLAAQVDTLDERGSASWRSYFPMPPDRGTVFGKAILSRGTVHVEDLGEDRRFPEVQRALGYRSALVVPLLQEGVATGAIMLLRDQVLPFSDRQIRLLETFADQAVIAIENTRQFRELRDRNQQLIRRTSELMQALEQQTATSEILRTISRSPTEVGPIFQAIVANTVRLCGSLMSCVFRFDGELIHFTDHHGFDPDGLAVYQRTYPLTPGQDKLLGRALLERTVVNVADVLQEFRASVGQHELGHRSVVAVPMLRDGRAIGVIATARREPGLFPEGQVELLKTFADQAVIAIENARLFRELQERNRDLAEALEQQTATAEILRATSGSPTDLQPVLELIADRAVRLCGAEVSLVSQLDGDLLRLMGVHGLNPAAVEVIRRAFPFRLDSESVTARAARARAVVHIPDLLDDPTYGYKGQVRAGGYRSGLGVPMLRDGQVIGVIFVGGANPGYFGERQVELLKTFADQAVIAIENVRLYRELTEKSRQLEEASRHKSEFLANMSHELRTPLNAIIGFSEVLAERIFGELNDKQLEYVSDVLTSGQHLLSLINDILDLSKVEAGRMELELSKFSLRESLENGLTMLKERAGRHDITLSLEVEDGLESVEADERKIKQVVFNLLSNAVKFTPDGGGVELSVRRIDEGVAVAVRDTGIGIAADDLPHVFDEFRQVGAGTARAEGTGLGLALTKKLVELHGGQIRAESNLGVGSTFTFTLPTPRMSSPTRRELPE